VEIIPFLGKEIALNVRKTGLSNDIDQVLGGKDKVLGEHMSL
jgi:hypothetical protein